MPLAVKQGLYFDGTGKFVDFGNKPAFDVAGPFTLEIELTVPVDLSSTFTAILGKFESGKGFDLGIQNGMARLAVRGTSNMDSAGAFAPDLRDGKKHRLRFDVTLNSITYYLDGVQRGSFSGTWVPVAANAAALTLGKRSNDGSVGYFRGVISYFSLSAYGNKIVESSFSDPSLKTGKNLVPPFSFERYTIAPASPSNNGNWTIIEPYKIVQNTVTNDDPWLRVKFPVLPNTTYTYSCDVAGPGSTNCFVDVDQLDSTDTLLMKNGNPDFTPAPDAPGNNTKIQRTFTTSAITASVVFFFYVPAIGTFTFSNPQFEMGSAATTFEPSVGTSYDPKKLTDQSGNGNHGTINGAMWNFDKASPVKGVRRNVMPNTNAFSAGVGVSANLEKYYVRYTGTVATADITTLTDGVVYLKGTKTANGDLRPYTPEIDFDKTKSYLIRFKYKIVQNPNPTIKGSLNLAGTAATNKNSSEHNLDGGSGSPNCRINTYTLPDGFEVREYFVPAGTVQGTGNRGRFGVFHDWTTVGTLETYFKDFEIYEYLPVKQAVKVSQKIR